jgi:hypothetical protein
MGAGRIVADFESAGFCHELTAAMRAFQGEVVVVVEQGDQVFGTEERQVCSRLNEGETALRASSG